MKTVCFLFRSQIYISVFHRILRQYEVVYLGLKDCDQFIGFVFLSSLFLSFTYFNILLLLKTAVV